MRRFFAALIYALCLFSCSITAGAYDDAFTLTPGTLPELGCDGLEYMPEQKIYHFTKAGSAVVDMPVSGGIYAYVTAGGYYSASNGVTDNGENCVCTIKMTFFDENGDKVIVPHGDPIILIPADGAFHRWSIGSDEMYCGLPENVKRVNLDVGAQNDTAYIKSLYISTSDMIARDMSAHKWEVHDVGNINAQTGTVQRIIMIAFICAVAGIMMIFAKVRSKYRKK
jgi:hypothetical protein